MVCIHLWFSPLWSLILLIVKLLFFSTMGQLYHSCIASPKPFQMRLLIYCAINSSHQHKVWSSTLFFARFCASCFLNFMKTSGKLDHASRLCCASSDCYWTRELCAASSARGGRESAALPSDKLQTKLPAGTGWLVQMKIIAILKQRPREEIESLCLGWKVNRALRSFQGCFTHSSTLNSRRKTSAVMTYVSSQSVCPSTLCVSFQSSLWAWPCSETSMTATSPFGAHRADFIRWKAWKLN